MKMSLYGQFSSVEKKGVLQRGFGTVSTYRSFELKNDFLLSLNYRTCITRVNLVCTYKFTIYF